MLMLSMYKSLTTKIQVADSTVEQRLRIIVEPKPLRQFMWAKVDMIMAVFYCHGIV
jgi:hypothetical protein